jgi:hypothetical protein
MVLKEDDMHIETGFFWAQYKEESQGAAVSTMKLGFHKMKGFP